MVRPVLFYCSCLMNFFCLFAMMDHFYCHSQCLCCCCVWTFVSIEFSLLTGLVVWGTKRKSQHGKKKKKGGGGRVNVSTSKWKRFRLPLSCLVERDLGFVAPLPNACTHTHFVQGEFAARLGAAGDVSAFLPTLHTVLLLPGGLHLQTHWPQLGLAQCKCTTPCVLCWVSPVLGLPCWPLRPKF